MKSFRLQILVPAALMLTMGLASVASAGHGWCFDTPTGQNICIPVWTDELPIKLPPNPGPYLTYDIASFGDELRNLTGSTQTRWVMTDAAGQRAFVVDFEGMQAFEVGQQVGSP
jgi:hypothetical protein